MDTERSYCTREMREYSKSVKPGEKKLSLNIMYLKLTPVPIELMLNACQKKNAVVRLLS